MISGIYHLIDTSLVQQLRFETVSNNIANLNTTGFKKRMLSFDRALTQNYKAPSDLSPGPLRQTGNNLDVALDTHGFFEIQTPEGSCFTRDGAFTRNAEGLLVNRSGYPVLGQNGPIQIEGQNVEIGLDGQVRVDGSSVDTLRIVDFENPLKLKNIGASAFKYDGDAAEVRTAADVRIHQGYLEGANVDPTQEMIKMIEVFRTFESAQKAIQCIDEMNSKMVNDYGITQ